MLVKPRTVPKTTSGKLRRAAARQLYESGELGRRRSLRQQILALWLSAQLAAMQRLERRATAFLFAAYWWTVMALLAAIGWILAVGLPRLGWRWTGLRIVTRMGLSLTGTGLAVEQQGTLPRPAIIVSNHQSYLDGLALAAALPGELRFVAKRELLHQPIARLALKALGTLFVERSDIEQGVEDVRRAAEAARSGARLVFFPEGALTRAVGLMPFKLGAFAVAASTGTPIVPVVIRGTRSILRSGQWFPRHGRITVSIAAAVAPRGGDLMEAARLREAPKEREDDDDPQCLLPFKPAFRRSPLVPWLCLLFIMRCARLRHNSPAAGQGACERRQETRSNDLIAARSRRLMLLKHQPGGLLDGHTSTSEAHEEGDACRTQDANPTRGRKTEGRHVGAQASVDDRAIAANRNPEAPGRMGGLQSWRTQKAGNRHAHRLRRGYRSRLEEGQQDPNSRSRHSPSRRSPRAPGAQGA